jgi:hypothetical protein
VYEARHSLTKAIAFTPAVPPKLRIYMDQLREHALETRLASRGVLEVDYIPPTLAPGVQEEIDSMCPRPLAPQDVEREGLGTGQMGEVEDMSPGRRPPGDDSVVQFESAIDELASMYEDLQRQMAEIEGLQKEVNADSKEAVIEANELLFSVNQTDQQQVRIWLARLFLYIGPALY